MREIVIQQATQPVTDETALIGLLPSQFAQLHFPCGQWADQPQPGLQDHDSDGQKMCPAKARIPDPRPATQTTGRDQQQSSCHKEHKYRVHH